MGSQWFIMSRQGGALGPFSSRQLRKLVAEGKVKPSTSLSPDGTRWRSASRVKGLFEASEAPNQHSPTEAVRVGLPTTVQQPQIRDWMSELHTQAYGASFEFASADTNRLSSRELEHIRQAIRECGARKEKLRSEASQFLDRKTVAKRKRRLLGWIPFSGYFFKNQLPALDAEIERLADQYSEVSRRANESGIELRIDLSPRQSAAFNQFSVAFQKLAACKSAWDVTSAQKVDQFRERTIASTGVTRSRVSLGVTEFGEVRCDYRPFEITNSNGAHLYLFPLMCFAGYNHRDFAVLDIREIAAVASVTNFQEEEGVPADATVVGSTWKRANKDGGRDRRFSENYEIPIVRYGELHFQSNTGLNELYMFSNPAAVESFCDALRNLQLSMQPN